MYYYCPICGILPEDRVEWKCLTEAAYSPNDLAHPAEFDDPQCQGCDSYVMDYRCDECMIDGNPDDQLLDADEKNNLTCHRCFARKEIETSLAHIQNTLSYFLVNKFNHDDDADTREYAGELIDEFLQKILSAKQEAVAHKNLDKKIEAWLDENYDLNHKTNSVRKHLGVEQVQKCADLDRKKKYWIYLSRGEISQ